MAPKGHERYLLVKGAAGMGNRILGLLSGTLYARITGRRLVVDWSDDCYSDDGANVFPLLLHCRAFDPATTLPASGSVWPEAWDGHLHRSAREMRLACGKGTKGNPLLWQKLSADIRHLDYDADIVVYWAFTQQIFRLRRHFHGPYAAWSAQTDAEVLRHLVREELALAPDLRDAVNEYASASFESKPIGVHVRYTDRKARLRHILTAVDRAAQEQPDPLVFLATDNREVERLFHGRYPRVLTTDKWLTEDGMPLHKNERRPDKLASARAALVDMHLLAHCTPLIVDRRSSFAYMATLLKNEPATVVDTQRWSRLSEAQRHRLWQVKTNARAAWCRLRGFSASPDWSNLENEKQAPCPT